MHVCLISNWNICSFFLTFINVGFTVGIPIGFIDGRIEVLFVCTTVHICRYNIGYVVEVFAGVIVRSNCGLFVVGLYVIHQDYVINIAQLMT